MKCSELKQLSFEEKQELAKILVSLYLSDGRVAVAQHLKIPYGSVTRAFYNLGVFSKDLRVYKWKLYREQPVYYNPFLVDSYEKWYLIGFILGDGSIGQRHLGRYSLVLSSSIREYAIRLLSLFHLDETRLPKPVRGNYSICFYDNSLVQPLLDLGFVEDKSHVGMRCPIPPEEFVLAFLAGLFDSDGSCGYSKRNPLHLTWYGHPSYLETVYGMVQHYMPSAVYKFHNNGNGSNLYAVYVTSTVETIPFVHKMYENVSEFCNPVKYNWCINHEHHGRMSLQASDSLNKELFARLPFCSRTELVEWCFMKGISESSARKRIQRAGLSIY